MVEESSLLATSLSSSLRSPCGAAADLLPSVLIVVFSLASSHPRWPACRSPPRGCAPPGNVTNPAGPPAPSRHADGVPPADRGHRRGAGDVRPVGRFGDVVRLRRAHLNASQACGVL